MLPAFHHAQRWSCPNLRMRLADEAFDLKPANR